MPAPEPIFALLSRALDAAALRQAVHTANIANAEVDGFRRLDVSFDAELERLSTDPTYAAASAPSDLTTPQVISTTDAVRLDQEMALMAKDAVQYQALINAFQRSMGLLRL